jgi:collagen type VII alpha
LATTNNKFLVKNGLAVGSSIDVINTSGEWIGATGTLHGATGPQGATGVQGIDGASGYVGSDGATGSTGPVGATGLTGATGTAAPYSKKTSNYTAVNGDYLIADTSGGAFTITLPSSPSTGNSVTIADGDSFYTNNLTIARNGSTIEGNSLDLVIDVPSLIVTLLYDGTTWEVFSSVGSQGATGYTGATGPVGATGTQGVDGASGYVGSDGATGTQGASGSTGLTGATGPTGATGIDGATGPQGASGSTGLTGATGTSGDRYLTSSTTSFTLADTGSETVTVGLGLAYSANQTIILTYDGSNHQHGRVTAYNFGTGALTFDKYDYVGTGTYASWTVNLDGAVGAQGASGVQGASGSTGLTGATGPQGASGSTGLTGATGPGGVWTYINGATTAQNGAQYVADTDGGPFTLTLPATPSTGFNVAVADGGNWSVNNLTIGRNGSIIEGDASDLIVDVGQIELKFIYDGTEWQLFSSIGAAGATGVSGASGVLTPWTKVTSTSTLSKNAQYIIDTTSGPFTVNLPASPSLGDQVVIQDGGNFSTNNLTIARNGSTIEGQTDNILADISGVLMTLIYDGSTWQISVNTGAAGATGVAGASGTIGVNGASGVNGATGPTGATGANLIAGASGAIFENVTTIGSNYTLTSGRNGMSVGPITVASGVSVTVPSGQRWVVL